MSRKLIYSGLIAGLLFIVGTLGLGHSLDGYSNLSQTVSEIGKVGSDLQFIYSVLLISVGSLSMVFAFAIFSYAKQNLLSTIPAWFIGLFGILDIGFAIYPTPLAMHNIIGLAHLVGYFAPLSMAIAWRNDHVVKHLITVSWLAFGLIIVGLVLNLSPMFKADLYPLEYYGVVQRLLLYSYYLWLVWLSVGLADRENAQE